MKLYARRTLAQGELFMQLLNLTLIVSIKSLLVIVNFTHTWPTSIVET